MIALLFALAPIICNTATHHCYCSGVTECTDKVVLVDSGAEFASEWDKSRTTSEAKFRTPCPKGKHENRYFECTPDRKR